MLAKRNFIQIFYPQQKLLCKEPNVIKINENCQSTVIPQIFVGGDLVLEFSTVGRKGHGKLQHSKRKPSQVSE